MSSVRVLAGLLMAITLLVTQLESVVVAAVLLPFLATLLAGHIDRDGGRLACSLVRAAARLLPVRYRDESREEWLDHVLAAGEHGVLPLTRAVSIALIAAPMLAVGLRVGRSTQKPSAVGQAARMTRRQRRSR